MKKFALLVFLFWGCFPQHDDAMRGRISSLSKPAQGIVSVSIEGLESGDTVSFNGNYHAPMQSVFKFPIALCILHKVDSGVLSLEQTMHISKDNFTDTITYSPMRDKYSNKDTDITLKELLTYMVKESDNIVCDLLLEKAGGPKQVENYIHSLGVEGIAIGATEREMHINSDLQYRSWCQAKEMTNLLKIFYRGKCLSKSSTDLLIGLMEEATTGADRIKGLLPKGTIVAHKSGTSGQSHGVSPATNDAGVITLPNGKHLIITVFVTNSKADADTRADVIAKIAKMAYDKMGIN
jgi:beta-lactamase class A